MIRSWILSTMFLSMFVGAAPAADAPSHPSADDVARHATSALAGNAWEKARYFAFTFNIEQNGKVVQSFSQRWDRSTGDYRVTGKDKEGLDFIVVMNVRTKQGTGWINGKEPEARQVPLLLDAGYRRFVSDTFWLLMSLKMMDPGVQREYAAERTIDSKTYDVIRLTFDKGGLTPGDQHWAWVNRETGMVDTWDMKVPMLGADPEAPPVEVNFRDYKRVGGLLISTRREFLGNKQKQVIRIDDLVIGSDVPKGAFAK